MALLDAARDILTAAATKLVVAAILLLVGVIIAQLAERLVHYILKQLEVNKILVKAGLPFALDETLAHLVKYALYFVTFVITLNQINLTTQVFDVLAFAVIVFVVVSIFLGLKDFVPNYWAGIWLRRKNVYKVGDVIVVNDIQGEVRKFDVLKTTVKTKDGDTIHLPSSLLLQSQITKKH